MNFESLLVKHQKAREKPNERGSKFNDENGDLLYQYLHKTSLRIGESYVMSPKWLENKRATINPKNKKDDNCFQYTLTLALNHKNIERDHRRVLISIIGKTQILRHTKKSGKNL